MSRDYPVPAGVLERETVVRKSRFIARVAPVAHRDEVKSLAQQAWQDHPEARHVCWAYQIGPPGSAAEAGMNDDGEPSGTAGKPILNVIQHKDMGDVAVVVIRYFGGIRLGAGGLVRAYAGAAESVLSVVERQQNQAMAELVVNLPFAMEQPLRHWCHQNGAEPAQADYGEGVTLTVLLPEEATGALIEFCQANQLDYHLNTGKGQSIRPP